MASQSDGCDHGEDTFTVTIEDCRRWVSRLEKMADALEQKGETSDNVDNIRMLTTCAVLMSRLGLDIQLEEMSGGSSWIGEVGES